MAAILFSTCPKCGHVRRPEEQQADPASCPACGLIFAKWIRRHSFTSPARQATTDEATTSTTAYLSRLLFPESVETSRPQWLARGLVLLFLAWWGWQLAAMDYRNGEMGTSFMHNILLPIHEAGHVLFIPFGEFMTIAGGSLFQWLLPLVCAGAFLLKNRDAFGAAVGLWWSGTSLLDLAPYIYDAKHPQLILLGGHTGEDGPHDWIYLLDQFGKVHQSPAYGSFVHGLGVVVMVLALVWAGLALLRQWQNSDKMGL